MKIRLFVGRLIIQNSRRRIRLIYNLQIPPKNNRKRIRKLTLTPSFSRDATLSGLVNSPHQATADTRELCPKQIRRHRILLIPLRFSWISCSFGGRGGDGAVGGRGCYVGGRRNSLLKHETPTKARPAVPDHLTRLGPCV